MSNLRIHEFAKQIGLGSKDVMEALKELGAPAKSHMSGVDAETQELLKDYFTEKGEIGQAPPPQEAPTEAKKPPAEEKPAAVEKPPAAEKPSAVKKPAAAEKPAADKKPPVPEEREPEKPEEEEEGEKKLILEKSVDAAELARRLGAPPEQIAEVLRTEGKEAPLSKILDYDTIRRIASRFGREIEIAADAEDALLKIALETEGARKDTGPRAPVVTIMGHVDHGKTTILDEIRKSRITEAEAGSITQHIGAYYVHTSQGDVVFLDTPGHQAFTAMRARGAHVTDIVVLVVAVDDGIMPQTQEAIRHSQAAGVPIIVALNKIDRAKQNVEKIKRSFARFGLIPEEDGGETIFVETSATQRIGLDSLIEMILLLAEFMDLRAPRKGPAKGLVIETRLDRGRGPVATVLVQQGVLKRGDFFVAGVASGKVRAMIDDRGREVKEAGPSRPVEIMGFDALPEAGDCFYVIPKGKKAKEYITTLGEFQRQEEIQRAPRVPREPILLPKEETEPDSLKIILKVDVFGSLGALSNSLQALAKGEIKFEIIHSGVGNVTKADVSLAEIASAEIIGFGIKIDPQITAFAKQQGVIIRIFDIIYTLLDYVDTTLKRMEKPTLVEEELGTAEVRQVFSIPSIGKVAGCFVLTGRIARDAKARLFRGGEQIYDGKIGSLKRFKKDVKEVQTNFDCGIGLMGFHDYEPEDVVHCYRLVEKQAG